ncbi:hypothetical protein BSLG_004014 [Batrachochytrium salamandrivorans]|nr:hypothetical protein BSLG_004014 [Batrachochytrium salamandrivorans]
MASSVTVQAVLPVEQRTRDRINMLTMEVERYVYGKASSKNEYLSMVVLRMQQLQTKGTLTPIPTAAVPGSSPNRPGEPGGGHRTATTFHSYRHDSTTLSYNAVEQTRQSNGKAYWPTPLLSYLTHLPLLPNQLLQVLFIMQHHQCHWLQLLQPHCRVIERRLFVLSFCILTPIPPHTSQTSSLDNHPIMATCPRTRPLLEAGAQIHLQQILPEVENIPFQSSDQEKEIVIETMQHITPMYLKIDSIVNDLANYGGENELTRSSSSSEDILSPSASTKRTPTATTNGASAGSGAVLSMATSHSTPGATTSASSNSMARSNPVSTLGMPTVPMSPHISPASVLNSPNAHGGTTCNAKRFLIPASAGLAAEQVAIVQNKKQILHTQLSQIVAQLTAIQTQQQDLLRSGARPLGTGARPLSGPANGGSTVNGGVSSGVSQSSRFKNTNTSVNNSSNDKNATTTNNNPASSSTPAASSATAGFGVSGAALGSLSASVTQPPPINTSSITAASVSASASTTSVADLHSNTNEYASSVGVMGSFLTSVQPANSIPSIPTMTTMGNISSLPAFSTVAHSGASFTTLAAAAINVPELQHDHFFMAWRSNWRSYDEASLDEFFNLDYESPPAPSLVATQSLSKEDMAAADGGATAAATATTTGGGGYPQGISTASNTHNIFEDSPSRSSVKRSRDDQGNIETKEPPVPNGGLPSVDEGRRVKACLSQSASIDQIGDAHSNDIGEESSFSGGANSQEASIAHGISSFDGAIETSSAYHHMSADSSLDALSDLLSSTVDAPHTVNALQPPHLSSDSVSGSFGNNDMGIFSDNASALTNESNAFKIKLANLEAAYTLGSRVITLSDGPGTRLMPTRLCYWRRFAGTGLGVGEVNLEELFDLDALDSDGDTATAAVPASGVTTNSGSAMALAGSNLSGGTAHELSY